MALAAANKMNNGEKFNESYISGVLSDLVKSYDLRSTVFATFYRVGFDLHELSNAEKQAMELITLYPFLKNGEIWRDIKEELEMKQHELEEHKQDKIFNDVIANKKQAKEFKRPKTAKNTME